MTCCAKENKKEVSDVELSLDFVHGDVVVVGTTLPNKGKLSVGLMHFSLPQRLLGRPLFSSNKTASEKKK